MNAKPPFLQKKLTQHRMNKRTVLLPLASFFLLLMFISGCSNESIFHENRQIPSEGWNKDSLAEFNVAISDTSAQYELFINIRNTNNYPHQNFWMFVSTLSPDSNLVTDTIECYLANEQGKWLGSGISSFYEMQVLLQDSVRFKSQGNYRFSIRQGMREDVLQGISDIGLEVQKEK